MKRFLLMMLVGLGCALTLSAQVSVNEGRFKVGDDPAWSKPGFNDSDWQVLSLEKDWNKQGIRNPNSFAWYRLHVVIPSTLKKGSTDKVLLDLGPIDDTDETWLNGTRVGKTGSTPEDPQGYDGDWQAPRRYVVDPKLIKWDQENVIAVRVYNGGDPGGFYAHPAAISSNAPATRNNSRFIVCLKYNDFHYFVCRVSLAVGRVEVTVRSALPRLPLLRTTIRARPFHVVTCGVV